MGIYGSYSAGICGCEQALWQLALALLTEMIETSMLRDANADNAAVEQH